jgi:hypothetical protein
MRPLRLTGIPGMAVLTAVFGAAGLIAGPGTASAAGPVTETARALYGVSCPAAGECVAVGFNQEAEKGRGAPLAAIWNGKTWKGATLPLPAGGTSGKLVAVSCPTKTKCVAVGAYSGGLLAETWNGKAWTPTALPTDKGFNHEGLAGVSCPTTTRCVAIGYDLYEYVADRPRDSSTNALAEIWNGSKWTIVRLNSVLANLSSVSCPSANSCLAVGTWLGESAYATAAVSWNGETWKVLPQTSGAAFTGVSCSSAAHCVVVGDTVDPQIPSASMAGLADLWNGRKWSALRLPWPKGSDSYLTGVSCTRAGNCATAGGEDLAPNAVPVTGKAAAATWNGKTWTIAKLPALHAGRSDVFNAVSCPSATQCVAVGQYEPNKAQLGTGWTGIWNGKTWKQIMA